MESFLKYRIFGYEYDKLIYAPIQLFAVIVYLLPIHDNTAELTDLKTICNKNVEFFCDE